MLNSKVFTNFRIVFILLAFFILIGVLGFLSPSVLTPRYLFCNIRGGAIELNRCLERYSDANKPCTDSSQCLSKRCIVESHTAQELFKKCRIKDSSIFNEVHECDFDIRGRCDTHPFSNICSYYAANGKLIEWQQISCVL